MLSWKQNPTRLQMEETLYLWPPCDDPSPPSLSRTQVRRIFGQVMIAMAHHNYLSLEGGELMVEFIVRQCSIDPDDKVMTS